MRKYIKKGPDGALVSLSGPDELTSRPFVSTTKNIE